MCTAYVGFVCVQPFYLNLVESGKAFVQVEQERDNLRAVMEQLTRKCLGFLYVFALSIVNDICPSISGDKATAEFQVKELEEALAKERAESKKALDDAKDSAALREKNYA